LTDPAKNVKGELVLAGHFDKSIQWGTHFKYTYAGAFNPVSQTLYFNHEKDGNVAGGEFAYDYAKKSFASKFGLKWAQEDHTWKFRIHNDGLFRAALQWQLHKTTKATLNSSVNLKDVPAGKIGGVPLGLSLEVKY